MAIIIKTTEEIAKLREGGPIAARILRELSEAVRPGIPTQSLDELARKLIKEAGGTPTFLGFKEGKEKPFPAAICISINDEIVHGLPSERALVEGDLVSIDLGFTYKGVILDLATSLGVGTIAPSDRKLLSITKQALDIAIKAAQAGNHTGDIGAAVEAFVMPIGFGIVRDLAGHGVGRELHEDPFVPNYGKKGTGALLKSGMVLAIEPMLTRGGSAIVTLDDRTTIATADHSRAAHFEHTVLINENGLPEMLTKEE